MDGSLVATKLQLESDGTLGHMGDFFTITVATQQDNNTASKLLNDNLNDTWISWGQRASHNWIEAASDVRDGIRRIGVVGLLGINRTAPTHNVLGEVTSNSYRVIFDGEYPVASRRRPEVVSVANTNLSGTALILNGPVDPPDLVPASYTQTKFTATSNAANTILVATFANYNATERPLVSINQKIRVHYVHTVDVNTQPTLTTVLRYNGVDQSTLSAISVERTSEGFMFTYQFNPGTLPGLTGQIGIKVTGQTTGTSTPVPIGVEWVAELEWPWDSLTDTRTDADASRPQIVELPELPSIDPDLGVMPVEILPGLQARVYIEMSDFSIVTDIAGILTYYPAGGFNGAFFAGRLVIGESIELPLREKGLNLRKVGNNAGALTRSYGGFLRSQRNSLTWWEADFAITPQSQSRLFGEISDWFNTVGYIHPVLYIPDKSDLTVILWGIIVSFEATDAGEAKGKDYEGDESIIDDRFDVRLSIMEANAMRTVR